MAQSPTNLYQFRNNRVAIAIEHGLNNKIYNNLFIKDKEAIRLWAREKQPSDWGYAKYRDTRSAAYAIVANSFNDNNIVYNLDRSDSIYFFNNSYSATSGTIYKTTASVSNLDTIFNPFWDEYFGELKPVDPPVITNPRDPFKGSGIYNGRKNIRMTEWGPYDFGYPIIWNTNPTDSGDIMEFDLIGPKGKWAIKKIKGVEQVSINTGTFPSKLTARKIKATKTDIAIEVEYKGPAFVNEFGEKITANKPYNFFF